jgi:Co/Zn/Cd efflux system component
MEDSTKFDLNRAIKFVAIANLIYFGVEGFFALKAGSVSLFADSIDFLEDASVNFLILFALKWSASSRAKVGKLLALLILFPAIATLGLAIGKLFNEKVPEPHLVTAVGIGAFIVNAICALRLARFRKHSGTLTKAAFLSARNDLLANIAIVLAGILTAYTQSFLPDLIVGIGIAVLNLDAAKQVWRAANQEHLELSPLP